MSGRGHGRLIGSSSNTNQGSRGRGRGRGTFCSIELTPVNTPKPISRQEYNRNKLDKKLHPDDAGLGDDYVGSLPWHIRNHGLIWVPKDQRPVISSRTDDSLVQKSTLGLPENEGTVARDFDEIGDELQYCHMNRLEFLWTVLAMIPLSKKSALEVLEVACELVLVNGIRLRAVPMKKLIIFGRVLRLIFLLFRKMGIHLNYYLVLRKGSIHSIDMAECFLVRNYCIGGRPIRQLVLNY